MPQKLTTEDFTDMMISWIEYGRGAGTDSGLTPEYIETVQDVLTADDPNDIRDLIIDFFVYRSEARHLESPFRNFVLYGLHELVDWNYVADYVDEIVVERGASVTVKTADQTLHAPKSYQDARGDASLHVLTTMRRFVERATKNGDIEDPGEDFIFELSPAIQDLLGTVDQYITFDPRQRQSAVRNIQQDPLEAALDAQEIIADIRAEANIRGSGSGETADHQREVYQAATNVMNQIDYLVELLEMTGLPPARNKALSR